MKVTIDGNDIRSEADLYVFLAEALDLGDFYGRNLSALWDRFTSDVERPLEIIWINASQSRKDLGDAQSKIEKLFRDVEEYDKNLGLIECFQFKVVE